MLQEILPCDCPAVCVRSVLLFWRWVWAPVALGASALIAQMPPGVPESLDALTSQPASHMGYTFDRSQLQAAQQILESGGLPADRAAAALNSISFDTYRYKEPAFYTPEAMAAIVEAYRRAGWKHLVDGNPGAGELGYAEGVDDGCVAALFGRRHRPCDRADPQLEGHEPDPGCGRPAAAGPAASGGHFGIPKVDPNAVMVPAPDGR